MFAVETAVRVISLCLCALLALAVVHKVRVLAAGMASSEPLIKRRSWRNGRAAGALVLAGAAELVVIGALLVWPAVGFVAVSVLLALYSLELSSLDPDLPCNCFGEVWPTRTATAMKRNVSLAVLAASGGVLYATELVSVAPVSQRTVGIALVVITGATAGELRRRLMGSAAYTTVPTPSGGMSRDQ
jgi:hypothetical protein